MDISQHTPQYQCKVNRNSHVPPDTQRRANAETTWIQLNNVELIPDDPARRRSQNSACLIVINVKEYTYLQLRLLFRRKPILWKATEEQTGSHKKFP